MLPLVDLKEMGIGLAAAVLIDATIVRGVLLPASMKLLGERELVPAELARSGCPRRKHERSALALEAEPALAHGA